MPDWNNDTVRNLERTSIRGFVASCSEYLTGSVLDYGCGKQPYRDIVEAAGGEYHGFDLVEFPANVSGVDYERPRDGRGVLRVGYDAILCNQVLQYVPVYGDYIDNWDLNDCRETPLADLFEDWRNMLLSNSRYRLFAPPGHLVLTYATNWAEVETADLCRWTKAGMEHLLALAGFTVVRHEERGVLDLNGFRLPTGYGIVARA